MFTAALFTVSKNGKCRSIGKWQIVVHPYLDYYSATKKKKLLIHPTIWMDLTGIVLSGGGGRGRPQNII